MHVKGDDVLRNYLFCLLRVLSSLYGYLNQQASAAFNQEVERHRFMCECGKTDPYLKKVKSSLYCVTEDKYSCKSRRN